MRKASWTMTSERDGLLPQIVFMKRCLHGGPIQPGGVSNRVVIELGDGVYHLCATVEVAALLEFSWTTTLGLFSP